MTIILDPETHKIYSLYWSGNDDFKRLRAREITMEQAQMDCKDSHDYLKIQRIKDALGDEKP
jgi:hypothetical protein